MSGRPAGFAFDGFDGHARAGDAAIASPAPATGEPERGFVRGRITLGGMPRPIIDLSAVLTAIESRWQSAGHRKG
jgi:hypothetical protein